VPQSPESDASEPAKVLRSYWHAHLHALLHSAAIPCISTHDPLRAGGLRRPVPLEEGSLGTQHQGRGLRDQAPLHLLQGEPTVPGGAGSGTGAATPARRPAPSASDDEEASDLITPVADDNRAPSPILDVLTSPNGGSA
jgi:hypothetical protein